MEEFTIEELQEFAKQGNVDAICILADKCFNGEGVKQDVKTAALLYELAAKKGDANAQYNLGAMYVNGEGVDRDCAKGLFWLEQAAMQNEINAQYALSILYGLGQDDIAPDKEKSEYWEKRYNENPNKPQ